MSLLLDALKKAAQEKKSADGNNEPDDIETLSLDSIEEESELELEQETAPVDDVLGGAPENLTQIEHEQQQHGGYQEDEPQEDESVKATRLTISSEALEVLVHKANKQYKARQKVIWGGVFSASVLIMLLGGGYFYMDMSNEMDVTERKHKLVMRQVTDTRLSRSVIAKIEEQKAREEEKANKNKSQPSVDDVLVRESAERASVKTRASAIVVKKSKKQDPISSLANKAWNAYDQKDYMVAEEIYKKILSRENNNRDALLGLAAISVKQGDSETARSIYYDLIQLNPRDTVAVAELTNLLETNPGELGESKLKLLIRQNSKSPHLHFALGNLLSSRSKWPEAQQSYFRAWSYENDNADYAFNLAVSLDQMGKQKEALKFYQLSIDSAEAGNSQISVNVAQARIKQLSDGQ